MAGECSHPAFKLREIEAYGAQYKMMLIQCSHCGAPAGVTDYYNLGALIKTQEKEINALKSQLATVLSHVDSVGHAINKLAVLLRK